MMVLSRKYIFFIVVLTLSVHSTSHAQEPLVFAGINGTIPFSYKEGDINKGVFCDIANEIIKRSELNARIELLSFALILRYLKEGTVDGCFMIYHNKERERFLVYAKTPVLRSSINVFVKSGNEFDFQTVKDLYNMRVGKQANFFTSNEFMTAVDKKLIVLDEARTCDMNLKKLIAGRIDCYIGGAIGTRYTIKKMGVTGQVVSLPNPMVSGMETFFVVSKASKNITRKDEFIEKINRIIIEMYEDGTMKRIEERYM